MKIPTPDPLEAWLSIRIAAAFVFALFLLPGFYAFVSLAFGISYREPLEAILWYTTALLCVVLVEIYLAKMILAGAFLVPAFSIRTLLVIVTIVASAFAAFKWLRA